MVHDTDRLVVVGFDASEHTWIRENLLDHLVEAGFDRDDLTPHPHRKVPQPDVRRAIADEDMKRKKASWVRDVGSKTLTAALESVNSRYAVLWGYSVTLPAEFDRVSAATDDLPEFETVQTVVTPSARANPHDPPDTEFHSEPQNTNAPFSYDPELDYYTEPENYDRR